MAIRSKLLLAYGFTLAALLAVGFLYYEASARWRHAAAELAGIHRQNERAEQLRAGIQRQASWALDFLGGDREAAAEIDRLRVLLQKRLQELEAMAVRKGEHDHLEGLRETWMELDFTIDQVISTQVLPLTPRQLEATRSRLRDIASEASEDVAVLNQFYRSEVDADIEDAARAGRHAELATGAAVAVVLVEFLLLVVLSQRWLVRPIAAVSSAAERISTGDFATTVHLPAGQEWQRLASSINHMANSLADLRQKLIGRERLATLGEAAAYVAHNIRNPLAAIRLTAQVTRSELAGEKDAAAESLQDIMQTVDKLDAWARRFLEFARPFDLHATPTDVNQLVSQTADLVAAKFRGESVRVEKSLADSLPQVDLDSVLVEQAVAAIVTNALEAKSSRVYVRTRLQNDLSSSPRIEIAVQDDGAGIAAPLQARLFRAFVSDKPGGTGLGLAQARSIVELHGGRLALQSAPGQGTRVTIDLPVAQTALARSDGGPA